MSLKLYQLGRRRELCAKLCFDQPSREVKEKRCVQRFSNSAGGLRKDLGGAGITVNNVQPAVIPDNPGPDHPARASMEKFTSVGRFGKTAEVAQAVAFLARPDSAFINGASLNVDGDWSA